MVWSGGEVKLVCEPPAAETLVCGPAPDPWLAVPDHPLPLSSDLVSDIRWEVVGRQFSSVWDHKWSHVLDMGMMAGGGIVGGLVLTVIFIPVCGVMAPLCAGGVMLVGGTGYWLYDSLDESLRARQWIDVGQRIGSMATVEQGAEIWAESLVGNAQASAVMLGTMGISCMVASQKVIVIPRAPTLAAAEAAPVVVLDLVEDGGAWVYRPAVTSFEYGPSVALAIPRDSFPDQVSLPPDWALSPEFLATAVPTFSVGASSVVFVGASGGDGYRAAPLHRVGDPPPVDTLPLIIPPRLDDAELARILRRLPEIKVDHVQMIEANIRAGRQGGRNINCWDSLLRAIMLDHHDARTRAEARRAMARLRVEQEARIAPLLAAANNLGGVSMWLSLGAEADGGNFDAALEIVSFLVTRGNALDLERLRTYPNPLVRYYFYYVHFYQNRRAALTQMWDEDLRASLLLALRRDSPEQSFVGGLATLSLMMRAGVSEAGDLLQRCAADPSSTGERREMADHMLRFVEESKGEDPPAVNVPAVRDESELSPPSVFDPVKALAANLPSANFLRAYGIYCRETGLPRYETGSQLAFVHFLSLIERLVFRPDGTIGPGSLDAALRLAVSKTENDQRTARLLTVGESADDIGRYLDAGLQGRIWDEVARLLAHSREGDARRHVCDFERRILRVLSGLAE